MVSSFFFSADGQESRWSGWLQIYGWWVKCFFFSSNNKQKTGAITIQMCTFFLSQDSYLQKWCSRTYKTYLFNIWSRQCVNVCHYGTQKNKFNKTLSVSTHTLTNWVSHVGCLIPFLSPDTAQYQKGSIDLIHFKSVKVCGDCFSDSTNSRVCSILFYSYLTCLEML